MNTVRVGGGEVTDTLGSDGDVKVWLGLAGVPVAPKPAPWPDGTLLEAARRLREAARNAIEARKAGGRPPLKVINAFLESSTSHRRLVARPDSGLELRRVYHGGTPEEYLLPVTEAAAELLAEGDFDLVRKSVMDVFMTMPHELRVLPGHTDETTIAREWEENPFVRVWRGAQPEGTEPCRVGGRDAMLIVWSPDYDGKGKAWVRFEDG